MEVEPVAAPGSLYTDVRDCLVDLYPEPADAERLVDTAEIPRGNLTFDDTPINRWHKIVREARKQQRLTALLEAALTDYSSDARLPSLLTRAKAQFNPTSTQARLSTAGSEADTSVEKPSATPASSFESRVPPDWATSTADKLAYLKQAIAFLEAHFEQFKQASDTYGRCVLFSKEVRRLQLVPLQRVSVQTDVLAVHDLYWNANSGDVLDSYTEVTKTMVESWLDVIDPPLRRISTEMVNNYEEKSRRASECIGKLSQGFDEDSRSILLDLFASAKAREMLCST